ncbi:MAG: sulfite exporter TauE/SafE family protein [Pseudomonadota bacterium]
MFDLILEHFRNPISQIILLVVFITGIVRGFSGFGSGMIIGPTIAAFFTPQFAIGAVAIIDSLPTAKLIWGARKDIVWRQVIPIVIGYALLMPIGIWVLKSSDPIALRWFISISICIAVALLWSGWKYSGPRSKPVSLGVGAVGGFMGASSALPGPAPLLYWMSGKDKATIIRANMIYYLFLTDVIVIGGYWMTNIFTAQSVALGIAASPGYFIGMIIGTNYFKGASDKTYRTIAFIMILIAAIASLPILDSVLRG